MCECVCGLEIPKGNTAHFRNCSDYQKEVLRLKDVLNDYIAKYYLETYSVSECCKYVIEKESTKVFGGKLRNLITEILKKGGVYEGISGKNTNDKRQSKMQASMLNRYGVINNGQRPGEGFKKQNLIPYKKLKINEEFNNYRKEVESMTKKQVDKIKKINLIPNTCYYTDIAFNDNLLEKVNPNDPLKRTIDHKISVNEAFFYNWPTEKTAAAENLVFCLRIVNTVKGHMNENEFRKTLLPLLKERLKNENQ